MADTESWYSHLQKPDKVIQCLYRRTTARQTRENRTITVDFQHEATYLQLLGNGKAFVECVLAFILSLGFQLKHKTTCRGGGCLTRRSHYVRVRLGGVTIWRLQCTTCRAVFTILPHFALRYRQMRPEVAEVIADWKHTPGTVGIRIMLTQEAGHEPTDPGLDRILRAAVRHDFPVNMLCWGNVDAGMALIDRHPDTRFIIDHLALVQPRTPPAPPQPWADLPQVLALATRPNAVIKVSGACTLSQQPYPFPDIWDPLARVFDAWGFDRCLWGTDWTRAFAVVNYAQAVEPFRQTDRLSDSERAMLMGGACAKAYGWSPKNG